MQKRANVMINETGAICVSHFTVPWFPSNNPPQDSKTRNVITLLTALTQTTLPRTTTWRCKKQNGPFEWMLFWLSGSPIRVVWVRVVKSPSELFRVHWAVFPDHPNLRPRNGLWTLLCSATVGIGCLNVLFRRFRSIHIYIYIYIIYIYVYNNNNDDNNNNNKNNNNNHHFQLRWSGNPSRGRCSN